MALIGVFGLNMSSKSGGAYYLINGLMAHAQHSKNSFLYIHEGTSTKAPFPDNVESVVRNTATRFCVQGLLALPFVDILLSSEAIAFRLLSAASGIVPQRLCRADVWLWPHCCSPVPSLTLVVAFFHDMNHQHHPEFYSPGVLFRRKRAELSMGRCAAILCPSDVVRTDLVRTYPRMSERTTVCWETACEVVSREHCEREIRAIRNSHGTDTLFLYVAADWPHKNHALLIESAMDLQMRTNHSFKVVFVGPRRTHRLQRLIAGRQATDLVVDVGPVTRMQLAAYFYTATCLVHPSLHEGFGIPLVEAMKCGTPIVASNIASIPEVCGDAAVLLPPTDAYGWAREMLRMIVDKEHRAKCSQSSLDRGMLFSWERCWRTIDEVLSKVISARRQRT
jgi:glycosyltransferase involved in cell wall biosynthesis